VAHRAKGEAVSRVDIVHYVGATAKSLSVVATLVKDLTEGGHDVRLLDIESSTYISQDYPPGWISGLFGHRFDRSSFEREVTSLGATYHRVPRVAGGSRLPEALTPVIQVAIESEVLTYFRTSSVPATKRASTLRSELTTRAALTYWALRELWSREAPDEVLIPNGRTSRQKTARLLADDLGIAVRLYENGRARPHSYYLGNTQPHDRVASQVEVASLTAHLTDAQCAELAREWLAGRMAPGESTNAFRRSWTSTGGESAPGKTRAVFFTSSFDEFLAFGPMWTIDEWSSQFEAFDLIMSILERRGIDLVLRIHPNLATKSRTYVRRTTSEVDELVARHPGLSVYWHNSPVNSYELVKTADVVIVERSTIGLEASLLGKPVWVTQASQWDQIADIRQLLSPAEVTEEALEPWEPQTAGAQRFVAYWMIQEYPLHYSWRDWSTWDPEDPPLRMRIARFAVRNPWPHRLHLASLEWAKLANAGSASNKRVAKG